MAARNIIYVITVDYKYITSIKKLSVKQYI